MTAMTAMTTPQLLLADALGHPSSDKRIDILRRIGQVGSISEAARGAGVSYRAAWQALDTLSNLAGLPLLEKLVGGAGGGGARLTEAGLRLLEAADRLNQARTAVLAQIDASPGLAGRQPDLSALALRTSMRNQLPCTVQGLKPDAGAVRVTLRLAGGALLSARITRESAELLGLQPRLAVLALCKATAVSVVPHADPADGRNALSGKVNRTSRSVKGGQVALTLDAGLQLVGFTGAGPVLKVGQAAMALIDASALVVAVTR
jgi:molybdate transport system regulatory protein